MRIHFSHQTIQYAENTCISCYRASLKLKTQEDNSSCEKLQFCARPIFDRDLLFWHSYFEMRQNEKIMDFPMIMHIMMLWILAKFRAFLSSWIFVICLKIIFCQLIWSRQVFLIFTSATIISAKSPKSSANFVWRFPLSAFDKLWISSSLGRTPSATRSRYLLLCCLCILELIIFQLAIGGKCRHCSIH